MTEDTAQDGGAGHDDLTRITGIGPDIARRIDEAGIHTYAELGACSANDLARLLPDISPLLWGCIDAWRHDAQQLAVGASRGEVLAACNGQHYQSFVVRVMLNDDGSIRDTRMEHIGTGEVQRWAGWEHEAMLAFIQKAAEGPLPLSAPTPYDEASQSLPVATASSIARQPVSSKQAGSDDAEAARDVTLAAALLLERTVLHAGEPFTITMTLDLASAAVPERLAYNAVIVARQLGGGSRQTLARQTGLRVTAGTLAIQARAAGLPAGIYRLDGAVSLRETGASHPGGLAAAAEGIILQVMEG